MYTIEQWNRLPMRIPMVELDAKSHRIRRTLRVACVFATFSMVQSMDFAINH